MAFTVTDFEDLARLLSEHAEWRTRLRPLILGEEVLQVPSRMDRVEAALDRLSEEVAELREATRENTRFIASLRDVAERQTEQPALMASRMDGLDGRMDRLDSRMDRLDGRMANLEGGKLEARYERNVDSLFSTWLKGAHLLTADESDELMEAFAQASINAAEQDAVRQLHLKVRGMDTSTGAQLTLAVEVSHTINVDDVERAAARASIMRRAGVNASAAVGGFRITEAARSLAAQQDVIVDLHRPS